MKTTFGVVLLVLGAVLLWGPLRFVVEVIEISRPGERFDALALFAIIDGAWSPLLVGAAWLLNSAWTRRSRGDLSKPAALGAVLGVMIIGGIGVLLLALSIPRRLDFVLEPQPIPIAPDYWSLAESLGGGLLVAGAWLLSTAVSRRRGRRAA